MTHTTFNVKPSKSSAMLFCQIPIEKPEYPTEVALTLSGHTLPYDDSYKYLGLTLDRSLKWLEHSAIAVKKATATAHQITRIVHRTRTFSVHCVATLVRTVLIPRCMYASQFWHQKVNVIDKLNTAIVKPLKRALGLPNSTHTLSILTECDVLTATRYAQLYNVNYMKRALLHPNINPSTARVAANATSAAYHESQTGSYQSLDRILPKLNSFNSLYDSPANFKARDGFRRDQVNELRTAHHGSSMRLTLPTNFAMHSQPHIRNESIPAAQRRAKFRFDTVSPWREYTKASVRTPQTAACKWCDEKTARSVHLLRCPGLTHIRIAHPKLTRLCTAIQYKSTYPRHRSINYKPKLHFCTVQALLSGHHPLLSDSENAEFMAASQQLFRSLLHVIESGDKYAVVNQNPHLSAY